MNSPVRKGPITWWPLALTAVVISLVFVRAELVEAGFGEYVGCQGCFRVPSLSADGWIVAFLCALLMVVVNSPWRWAGRLAGLAITGLLLLFVADLYILKLFGIRLFFIDLAVYGLEWAVVWDQFSGLFGGPWPAFGFASAILVAALAPAWLPVHPHRLLNLVLAAILTGSLLVAVLPVRPDYVNNWIYANVLQANLLSTESVSYSHDEAARLEAAWREAFPHRCVRGPVDRRNVIVVIIESWSNYQSQAFGGLYDWTPELDAIAREHQRYLQYVAGGYSTNEGLVNLLGGVRLWAPFHHLFEAGEFSHAWGIEPILPGVFNAAGFQTAMLTPGPLDYLRYEEWFGDLGFDYIEGREHPFYNDWPAVSFHAAADEALYKRAIQWVEQDAAEHFLAIIETVSTHQPYVVPDTGERDIRKAFAYADRWAAWFYQELRARGYFDGGVLIITSDHRSMNPVSGAERERFGLAAPSLIPMVLVDDRLPRGRAHTDIFQPSDILPSFRHRLEGQVCMDEFEASLFEEPPNQDNCAFHLRGAARGIVDVICAEGQGQVRLDGDNTAFRWHDNLDEERRGRILATIARDRLEGLRRHRRAGGG